MKNKPDGYVITGKTKTKHRTNLRTNKNKRTDSLSSLENLIKVIGHVETLNTEQLIQICRSLVTCVSFCQCVKTKNPSMDEDDYLVHTCDNFNHHDFIHTTKCKCCQSNMLSYYLGWCMEKLANENRLPLFADNMLSKAKIRNRTFGYEKDNNVLTFRIWRHYNAWSNLGPVRICEEIWSFDFDALILKKR
jgi:hypothetical protein